MTIDGSPLWMCGRAHPRVTGTVRSTLGRTDVAVDVDASPSRAEPHYKRMRNPFTSRFPEQKKNAMALE